jgi:ATP synthase protein I
MPCRCAGAFEQARVCPYNRLALPKVTDEMTMADLKQRPDPWQDSADEAGAAPFKALTREEAQALRAQQPALSPWTVVVAQAGLGVAVALLAVLLTHQASVGWSVLYGAATVVLPAALMARGMTSALSRLNVGTSAFSFMLWEMVKIGVSVAMLALAPKLVQPLSWPALLVGLVLCMKVYWLALLWRGR